MHIWATAGRRLFRSLRALGGAMGATRPTRRLTAAACCTLAVVCATGPARAQCHYEATLFDYPIYCAYGWVITIPRAVNRHGAVVGSYLCPLWNHEEAFLWTPQDGYMTLPRPPGVRSSIAEDINDEGIITGTYIVENVGFRGFVYENGQYTELPPLPGGVYSWAVAINEAGQVIGARAMEGPAYSAFVWTASGGFVDLGVMHGGYSFANAISDTGQVVGRTGVFVSADAFSWRDGELTLLGPIPGGFTSEAHAVSENGVIVGSGQLFDGSPYGAPHAFVWKNASYTLLGTLPDHAWSRAHGVSPDGRQVVGRSWNVNGNPNIDHGFIYQDGVMTNINDLVDAGFTITGAYAVTDTGVIVANGSILTPTGQPPGDLDNNCRVGVVDFLILLAHWGDTGSRADLNQDGTVDEFDFAILLQNWG
jgi:probable HAF family extracellular repeat protein